MKQSKTPCDLKTCLLCRLCLKEWKPAISAQRQNFDYKKGEIMFTEGEEVTGIYFIYAGTVKVHKHWGSEKELIVRFAKSGDIVGHRGFGKENIYPVSATTLEPATACFINLDFFRASLKVNGDFIYELMMFYAAELQESEKNMRNLAHMFVKGRTAQALLTLANKFGINTNGYINIVLSRNDLASFVGTTYETVFRTLNELTDDKLISISGKDIRIIDFEGLTAVTKLTGN